MTRDEAAKACPIATAFVKQMREVFGDSIKVLAVQENGHSFGKVPEHWKEGTKDEAA